RPTASKECPLLGRSGHGATAAGVPDLTALQRLPGSSSSPGALSRGLFQRHHRGSCNPFSRISATLALTGEYCSNNVTGTNPPADAALSAFAHAHSPRRHKCPFRRCEGIQKNPNYYIYMSGKCSTESCRF